MKRILMWCLALSLAACSSTDSESDSEKMFTKISASESGVGFSNVVNDLEKFTIYNTYYVYNGGGVAVGDIDNDGLQDLLFSSNQNGCRLYRNLGNFKFDDITEQAGIVYSDSWTTGVCMIDVNADGLTDIHICRSGLISDTTRGNLLFLNNGNGTFTERSKEFGLHDQGPSNQIYFFDLDIDGDLDAYVINHPLDFENAYLAFGDVQPAKDSIFSNRFYLNDNGRFVESNAQLGVGMEKGFSLSASIGDLNNDGYPDVYVANDFVSPDHYYVNLAGKGFEDRISSEFGNITMLSMGSDIADANNDGLLDLFVVDMEPATHSRRKNYDLRLDKSFYDLSQRQFANPQYTRNMFFLGSETGFKEVARLSGISTTDWSWAALFQDLDNDGWKDVLVTNGTKRDIHNIDFIALVSNQERVEWLKKHDLKEFITGLPINLLSNYSFKNLNGIEFENTTSDWGLDHALNGQGAVYVDLDNDGALDIVVNNAEAPASIYRNNNLAKNSFLQIKFDYDSLNRSAIGAELEIWADGQYQKSTQFVSRGFQSSVSDIMHFGLGKANKVDSLILKWPNGKLQREFNIPAGKQHYISYQPNHTQAVKQNSKPQFSQQELSKIEYQENDFDEFRRDRIVPFGSSRPGPAMALADLNNDGIKDLIVGGATGTSLSLFLGDKKGDYTPSSVSFSETTDRECTAILPIDIEGDGDLDLYIGNGSNESWGFTEMLQDQVYINDGKGNFKLDSKWLLDMLIDTRCAVRADLNNDGLDDIFIGAGFVPTAYGWCVGSRILINAGDHLKDVSENFAPELLSFGSIYAAAWADVDGDRQKEFIVAGQWSNIGVFGMAGNKLKRKNDAFPIPGLWNALHVRDLNNDGHVDIVAGNHGLNSLFQASESEPLELFVTDLDGNSTADPILTHYLNHGRGTFIDKNEFCEKMPEFNNKFLSHKQFSEAKLEQVLDGKNLDKMIELSVKELKTVVLMNDGKGNFEAKKLPIEVQFAPINVIETFENPAGGIDIFLAGNSNSEFFDQGDIRANTGIILRANSNGDYVIVPSRQTGLNLKGIANSSVRISDSEILIGRNDAPLMRVRQLAQ